MARPICFRLLTHWSRRAASRAAWTAGRSRAISTAMIAMTTSNSISVKPRRFVEFMVADSSGGEMIGRATWGRAMTGAGSPSDGWEEMGDGRSWRRLRLPARPGAGGGRARGLARGVGLVEILHRLVLALRLLQVELDRLR